MADDTSFSSRAIREFHNALTNGSIFGVPRYTTALLPPVTNNQGGLAWDTTTNTLKGCDGTTWAAAGSTFTGGAITSSITTPVDVGYGVGVNGGFISQQSAGTPDQSGFWTGTTSNAWIIAENADKAFDFAHAAATDPTLFIHSHNQSTTQWLGLTHDGTNGKITTGTGEVSLGSNRLLAGAGTAALPSLSFSGTTNVGFSIVSNRMVQSAGGVATIFYDSTASNNSLSSSWGLGWSSNTDPTAANADVALVRNAAGVIGVTNGSTGLGKLLYGCSIVANTGTVAPAITVSNTVYTNEGDADGSIINLPTAAAGLTYTVVCQAAQTITINASAGDTIRMAASVSGTAGLISTATVGNAVTLVAINATEWIATSYVGVVGVNWTVT